MKWRNLGVVGVTAALVGACGCGGEATVLEPVFDSTPRIMSLVAPIPAGVGPIWLLLYGTAKASDDCPTGPEVPSICIDSLMVH